MEREERWQDWVNLFLGVWLFVAPFFGIGTPYNATGWNEYIFGAIIIFISEGTLFKLRQWEEWTNLVIGLWLITSPFVLGFVDQKVVMWNHIIVGLVIVGGALSVVLSPVKPTSHKEYQA